MNLLHNDLAFITTKINGLLHFFEKRSIFITGGTGFIGKWLLETFLFLNIEKKTDIKITILSRNPALFLKCHPHLSVFNYIEGDIESFYFPSEKYDFIIHAASYVDAKTHDIYPSEVLINMIRGTERLLKLAKSCNVNKILYLSSGAVYGKQPFDIDHITESYSGAPLTNVSRSSYGEGKRASENLGHIFAEKEGVDFISARCFAFTGPYLPLDANYAVGNFINDGIKKKEITINGDGTTQRSYLYAADLVVWLLTILAIGKSRENYNVGSNQVVTIRELAEIVHSFFPESPIKICQPITSNICEKYIPSIEKAKQELGLEIYTTLNDSINKMISWNLQTGRKNEKTN